jgi:hypothetical protein
MSISDIFNASFILTLGITCALVIAVGVILYNKIQQQGEKVAAVMELSTVLAQEVQSHDRMLKVLSMRFDSYTRQNEDNKTYPPGNVHTVNMNTNLSNPLGENGKVELIDVSDGEEPHDIKTVRNKQLNNIIMNPMYSNIEDIDENSDSNDSDISSDNDNNEIERREEDEEDSSSDDEESDEEDEEDEDEDDDDEDDNDNEQIEIEDINSIMTSQAIVLNENISDIEELPDVSNDTENNKRIINLDIDSITELGDISANGDHLEEHESKIITINEGETIIDYKKLTVNELRKLALDKGLIQHSHKIKKEKLIDILVSN